MDKINRCIDDLKNRIYPFNEEGEIDINMFFGWDKKLDNPILYIEKLSDIDDYIPLMLLFVVLENTELSFIKEEKEYIFVILKKIYAYGRKRFNFHIVGIFGIILDLNNLRHKNFYDCLLEDPDVPIQNQAVSLILFMSEENFLLARTMLIEKYGFDLFILDKNISKYNTIQRKIYASIFYRNYKNKAKIYEVMRHVLDYEVSEYIDVCLYDF